MNSYNFNPSFLRQSQQIIPWLFAFLVLMLPSSFALARDLAFTNVRVFDGTDVIPQTTVVVKDGLITAIGEAQSFLKIPPSLTAQAKRFCQDLLTHTFTLLVKMT